MESLFSLNSIQDEFYQHERKNDEESKDESVSSVYGSQYLTEQDPCEWLLFIYLLFHHAYIHYK